MDQLLRITTVPISIELKINDAKLEYKNSSAEMQISRKKGGGLQIKSSPVRLNIDTFEARNSVVPTTRRSIEQQAQKGKLSAYQATARMAEQGTMFLKAKIGQDVIGQIAAQSTQKSDQFKLDFIPKTGPDITYQKPDLSIQYEMDKLNFDWKMGGVDFEFIPGNIEISVKQYPDVIIEYIGGPIYVPPSADPNYQPVDIKA